MYDEDGYKVFNATGKFMITFAARDKGQDDCGMTKADYALEEITDQINDLLRKAGIDLELDVKEIECAE